MEPFSVAVIFFAEKNRAGFRRKVSEIFDIFEKALTFHISHCDVDFNAHLLQASLFNPFLVG